jgi:hypothetical protein
VYNTVELMVVMTNLAPSGRRIESSACPGAASRVAVWATSLLVRRPYSGSRV